MYPNPNDPQQLPPPQGPQGQSFGDGTNPPQFPQPTPPPAGPPQPQYLAPTPDQAYAKPYIPGQAPSWQQPMMQRPVEHTPYDQVGPTAPTGDSQLPQPQLPGSTPEYTETGSQPPRQNHDKKILKWVIGIVVAALIVAGIVAFFMLRDTNKADNDATNKAAQDSSSQTKEVSLDTLEGVTLIPPNDLSRYTPNPDNTDVAMAYTTTDGSCSLNIGVADAEKLPGKDLGDIVGRQMKAARDKGLTLTGPTAGTPLELEDAADSAKKYSMPTLVFATSNPDGTHIRSHYSAVVLADDKRVYITRICQSKQGEVKDDTVKPIDEDAAKIVVRS